MPRSRYIVEFGGLPVGVHEYEFEVDDTFFKEIENNEIGRAAIKVDAALTKQNNLLGMHFSIHGTVGIECDRCLKGFDFPLEAEEDLVIKYGNPEESNDEILVIAEGQTQFDISHYLYEYIALALPARRVPCEEDPEQFECDWEMLDQIESHSNTPADETEENENNPMWEQLKKIKKFNQN